ncbi:MAG: hypothetical protein AB9856_12175 [Cellulosilyticaceae bacterium]
MFDLLKEEFKKGKKIYLLEVISIVLFFIFLNVGYSNQIIHGKRIFNYTAIGWTSINALCLVVYEFYDFSRILNTNKKLESDNIRSFVFKILIFCFLMSVNIGWIINPSVSMVLPLISLLIGYWILLMSRDILTNSKIGAALGTMWYITLFVIIGLLNPIFLMGINVLTKSVIVTQLIVNIAWVVIAMVIFKVIMKKLVKQ